MSTNMHIQDPWVEGRVAGHFNDDRERITELEGRVEELERVDTDDSFDDDQLSRLGINNIIPSEPEHTLSPRVSINTLDDLPRNYTPTPDTVLVADNHGELGSITIRDLQNAVGGDFIANSLDVTGHSYFMGNIYAQEGIEVSGSLQYNGVELTTMLDEMRAKIEHLENEVRSLREQNGQDNT